MKYFIFLVLTLMLLPFVATAQCGDCNEHKPEQTSVFKDWTHRLYFGQITTLVVGDQREPLWFSGQGMTLAMKFNRASGKTFVFADLLGYYNYKTNASTYFPWGWGAELSWPIETYKKSMYEFNVGAVIAYDKDPTFYAKTVTPFTSFSYTRAFKSGLWLRTELGFGPSSTTMILGLTNERLVNVGFFANISVSPNL